MNIGLFGDNRNPGGPGKVFKNLIKGLTNIGHNVKINQYSDFNGSLCPGNHPKNTLMGPNVMVIPTDDIGFWNKYTDYITPSKWVYDKYKSFNITKNTNFHIWSAGIDIEFFKPINEEKTLDCFIYFKNRYDVDLSNIMNFLNNKKLTYEIISYGSYDEQRLIDLCNKSKFCILIDNTESQGIAYMEILSMNIPIYVLDYKIWNGMFPATSVPYFDERCGLIENSLNDSSFEIFYNNLKNYKPREYIIENHTLEISAEKYVDILKNIDR